MLNIQLARKYGKAIFEIAQEEKKLDEYGKELEEVSQDLFSLPILNEFMSNPEVHLEDKKSLLKRIYAKSPLSNTISNFLNLLLDKHRIHILKEISDEYHDLYNNAKGIVVADVVTAFKMSAAIENKLRDKLAAVSGRDVKLRTHLDQSIIGGVIVHMADRRIDGSVVGRLKALKDDLMATI